MLSALSILLPFLARTDPLPQAPRPAPVETVEVHGVAPLHRVGNLWLGGQPDAGALEHLIVNEGVGRVIDLRRPSEDRGYAEGEKLRELGVDYQTLGFGAPDEMTDALLTEIRRELGDREGPVLLHCASSQRVSAAWLPHRVLDEHVPWERALDEAHRMGFSSKGHEQAARLYVQGGGHRELGRLTEDLRRRFPKVARLSPVELLGELASSAAPLVIDTRSAREYELSHLPGAVHAETPEAALELIGGPEANVVVYCSVGWRSAEMAEKLAKRGISKVRNLEGSIFAWANAGFPVYLNEEQVRAVDPFDRKWGRFLNERYHPLETKD